MIKKEIPTLLISGDFPPNTPYRDKMITLAYLVCLLERALETGKRLATRGILQVLQNNWEILTDETRKTIIEMAFDVIESNKYLTDPCDIESGKTGKEFVFFVYTHGEIAEGQAASVLHIDRLTFRDLWIAYLKGNPELAIATGHELCTKDYEQGS